MFPANNWYVAAMSRELEPSQVMARTLCEFPVAIYRDQSGAPAALLDRCAHRAYPLSRGVVGPEGLRCGYHGFVYDLNGQCVEIPSQSLLPEKACVRSFPVREKNGFIWFWPGDPELADQTPLSSFETGEGYLQGLDFSCIIDTANWGVAGPNLIHVDANYQLAVDNLLDLTHVAFLHESTFDNSAVVKSERAVRSDGNKVYDFFAMQHVPSKALRDGYAIAEEEHDTFLETYWSPPGTMILVHGATPKGRDREDGTIVLNTNILTPETSSTSHYFWGQSVWKNRGNGKVRDSWDVMTRAAFLEDEIALRFQQENLARFGMKDVGEGEHVVAQADRAIVMARKIVDRLCKAES